jgi:uncharacterized protein (DUF427 family)
MALTVGSGPFGQRPAGSFNFEPPAGGVLYLDALPCRIRGRLGGETVVDSRRPRMLHESGRLPVWYFPQEDVQVDRVPEGAVVRREEPLLAGLISVEFRALDEWLQEDEPVIGHPRDPFHRIDVNRSSRRVRISLDGRTLAESERPLALLEAGLPTRWYLPREDVHMDLLEPSRTRTTCAYKGHADHFSACGHEDVAWTYPEPTREVAPVKDLIAFYDEFVDVELDGEPQPRPRSPFSSR